ncbi:SDR family NAD(P)-dependent oxidoreductase, partial [Streptomyces spectabilis]
QVDGTVLVPATALIELALHVGSHADCNQIDELVLQTPIVLTQDDTVALQVAIEPTQNGNRHITIRTRPALRERNHPKEISWTENAQGTLTTSGAHPPVLGAWPPAGATPVPTTNLYRDLANHGYHYGPAFQGRNSIWRQGNTVYAEVTLPHGDTGPDAAFRIHPALFDAALHAILLDISANTGGEIRLPFSFTGVRFHSTCGNTVRTMLTITGEHTAAAILYDPTGKAVASIDAIVLRPAPTTLVAPQHTDDSLFELTWVPEHTNGVATSPQTWAILGDRTSPLAQCLQTTVSVGNGTPPAAIYPELSALFADGPAPHLVLYPLPCQAPPDEGAIPDAVRSTLREILALLQDWLASAHLTNSRLILLAQPPPTADDATDRWELCSEAARGLIRTAQTEHPDRFLLADIDHAPDSLAALPAAITTRIGSAPGERELSLRHGVVFVPRLAPSTSRPGQASIDPDGTVLITGGTGTLGSALARHLATQYQVRHLVLVSRSGLAASGAPELQSELQQAGATVTVTACDLTNRAELAELIASFTTEHPLTGVVHTAAALEDATLTTLTPGHLDQVLEPKASTAWHLHELTRHMGLSWFVLYSSAAGLFGTPGQGNYAAANVFLDALAHYRRSRGLPACSLAWGQWQQTSALTGRLTDADHARLQRMGIVPMSTAHGLRLFDAAVAIDRPRLVTCHLDPAILRSSAHTGTLHPVLRGLVRTNGRPTSSPAPQQSLPERPTRLPKPDPIRTLEDILAQAFGEVLGVPADRVDRVRPVNMLGVNSLAVLELRNRLRLLHGWKLPMSRILGGATIRDLASDITAVYEDGAST